MYRLQYKTTFSAAHQLQTAYSKECNDSLHGHNWIVEVNIEVEQLRNDMVIDFKKIKEIVHTLDHKNLCDILPFQTTAENIAKHIHNEICKEADGLVSITVWEGENSGITYWE